MIEKPFGHDLQSARELNQKLSLTFAEHEIFRIDHYLGKPMVQKLEILQQPIRSLKRYGQSLYCQRANYSKRNRRRRRKSGVLRSCRRYSRHVSESYAAITDDAASHLPKGSTSEEVRLKKKTNDGITGSASSKRRRQV